MRKWKITFTVFCNFYVIAPENEEVNMEVEEKKEPKEVLETKEMKQVSKIFCGKTKNVISFEIDGEKKESESNSEFKIINLNVENKDLYNAWEHSYGDTIEDYKPDDAHMVTAHSQIYLTDLPKVLFFMIKRVAYNREEKRYYKNNDPFDFDDVIYPDRFLIENRAEADHLRFQVNELRTKAHKLQSHIHKFNNYNDKKQPLGSVLHSCERLIKSNIEGMQSEEAEEELELFNPENLCKSVDPNIQVAKLNEISEFLNKLLTETLKQVE
jgi:hypothetical protein